MFMYIFSSLTISIIWSFLDSLWNIKWRLRRKLFFQLFPSTYCRANDRLQEGDNLHQFPMFHNGVSSLTSPHSTLNVTSSSWSMPAVVRSYLTPTGSWRAHQRQTDRQVLGLNIISVFLFSSNKKKRSEPKYFMINSLQN